VQILWLVVGQTLRTTAIGLAAGLLAGLLPARRAMRIDPAIALRPDA